MFSSVGVQQGFRNVGELFVSRVKANLHVVLRFASCAVTFGVCNVSRCCFLHVVPVLLGRRHQPFVCNNSSLCSISSFVVVLSHLLSHCLQSDLCCSLTCCAVWTPLTRCSVCAARATRPSTRAAPFCGWVPGMLTLCARLPVIVCVALVSWFADAFITCTFLFSMIVCAICCAISICTVDCYLLLRFLICFLVS